MNDVGRPHSCTRRAELFSHNGQPNKARQREKLYQIQTPSCSGTISTRNQRISWGLCVNDSVAIFFYSFILVVARGADKKFWSGESGTFFAVGVALGALGSQQGAVHVRASSSGTPLLLYVSSLKRFPRKRTRGSTRVAPVLAPCAPNRMQ